MSFNNVTDTSPISFHEQQQQQGEEKEEEEADKRGFPCYTFVWLVFFFFTMQDFPPLFTTANRKPIRCCTTQKFTKKESVVTF
jgi:hypothetical protein